MSNYPPMQPPPPHGQPGGYGQPGGGYPQQPGGYSMPPQQPGGYGMAPQPQQGNGWALASLLTSLIVCVPGLGLLGIIFGFVGLAKSKKTQSGKGLAIAGIVIGLLALIGWGVSGGAILALIKGTEANRDLAKQFITDLHAGNVDKAMASVDSSQISKEDLAGLAAKLKNKGAITDMTGVGVNAQAKAGEETQVVAVIVVTYADNTNEKFYTVQKKVGDQWKIFGAGIGDPK